MLEPQKNYRPFSMISLKNQDKALKNMDPSLSREFMLQRLIMKRASYNLTYLILKRLLQDRVLLGSFVNIFFA